MVQHYARARAFAMARPEEKPTAMHQGARGISLIIGIEGGAARDAFKTEASR